MSTTQSLSRSHLSQILSLSKTISLTPLPLKPSSIQFGTLQNTINLLKTSINALETRVRNQVLDMLGEEYVQEEDVVVKDELVQDFVKDVVYFRTRVLELMGTIEVQGNEE